MSLLREGSGCFAFSDHAAGRRGSIRVHFYVPENLDRRKRPLFVMHGLDREAVGFRDCFRISSERAGKIIIAPEYDSDAFPDVFSYNFGNVFSPPPCSILKNKSEWSFGIIERLFDRLREDKSFQSDRFDIYGNFAGSQFVLRYVALGISDRVGVAIASNSGVYMLPHLHANYPAGMGGLGLNEVNIANYFMRPLHIMVGALDTDSQAFDLPRWPEAEAQGPHRLARGLWYHEHCKALADRLGVKLAWNFEIVPGAGHISQTIFERAVLVAG